MVLLHISVFHRDFVDDEDERFQTLLVVHFCLYFLTSVLYLVEEQLPALLLPQVHHLHRHLSPAVFLSGDADDACGPLPDLHKVLQSHPRVSWIHHHLQRRFELLVSHFHASIRCRLLGGGGAEAGRGGSRGVYGGGAMLGWVFQDGRCFWTKSDVEAGRGAERALR